MARIALLLYIICEIMYTILTKASITKLLVFTGVQVSVASSSTCPSQLAPIDQTSNIFNSSKHKWDVLQTWILTACMRALMFLA